LNVYCNTNSIYILFRDNREKPTNFEDHHNMKNLIRYSVYSLCLFSACFLTSCGSGQVGRNFQSSGVSQIEVGKTTKTEVLEFFGEPYTTIEVAKQKRTRVHFGDEETVLIWCYIYESGSLFGSSGRDLKIEFDTGDRVVDYYYESTFSEDATAKSPTPANFDLFKARDQIMPGKTSLADVVAILGKSYVSTAFNKPGVAERWHYEYRENSKTEYTQLFGQLIRKTYVKSLDVFFDSNGIVLYCKGESDFPGDLDVK
jgi:outer membrane protein assembly factor BamE (lipoprotein component of BamABCDE complex)